MEIEIDRLGLQLTGMNISPARAQTIGDRVSAVLMEILRDHAADLSAAPAGYRVPFVPIPTLRVRAGTSDDEIARQVAQELARSILREMEI